MLNKWKIVVGFAGLMLVGGAFAGVQAIQPSQTDFSVSPGDVVEFSIIYPDGNPEATGLGLSVYFDSSKLSFVETSDLLTTPNLHQVQQPISDESDKDGNSDTDKKIVVAFANFGSDPFVSSADMPATLLKVKFVATTDFSSATTINFTGEPGGSHTFSSTSVSVSYNDTVAPIITLPANVVVEATGATTIVALGSATAVDTVDGELTATPDNTGPFAVGTHTVTWSATDSSGNVATATQTIIVRDTIAPTITAPANQSVAATGAQTAVTLGAPSVVDIADSSPAITSSEAGPFAVGTHMITWTATDASGNSSTAVQTIIVADSGAPIITVPANVTVEATGATTPVILGVASATDLVDGVVSTTPDKTGPFAVGVHAITWTATDSVSNTATATQTVTITDTTAPQLQAPSGLTVSATGETTQVDLGVATAVDLVDGALSASNDSPSAFPVGATTVTWTATDAKGNSSTATQLVTVSDGDGPSITAPANVVVEATGATTIVALGAATAVDTVDGELTATPDNTGPFAVGTHTVTWSATDSSGNIATVLQTVTVEDNIAPEIVIGSAVLQQSATGVQTVISDFGVTAIDLVAGNVTPAGFIIVGGVEQLLPTTGLSSGTHQLIWKAVDSFGNEAVAQQTVEIKPLVNFSVSQAASSGDVVTVTAVLSGEAVSYPVSVPYTIDTQLSTVANDGSDHDAESSGSISIESGVAGSFDFTVASSPVLNGAGQGVLVFKMGVLENVVEGAATSHTVSIFSQNIAPVVSTTIQQGNTSVTTIAKDAGAVLVAVIATDSAMQALSYDWGGVDASLTDLANDGDDATFEIDPSTLDAGMYTVVVAVSDNGSPLEATTVSTSFNVVNGATIIADSDSDGIEDARDNVRESNRLPEESDGAINFIIESETGTNLRLGNIALSQGQVAAAVSEAGLPVIPAEFAGTTVEIYDFEILGVARGASALIVIPQHDPIPVNATYLKTDGSSWRAFAEDSKNAVYSSQRVAEGICPLVGDASYTSGLTEGDYCVQLKIEDGGANDTDGIPNGAIADPGMVVGAASGVIRLTSTGGGGGGSIPWHLSVVLLVFAVMRRKLFGRT